MCHVPSRMGFCGQEAKLKRVSEMELIQKLYVCMCHKFDHDTWLRNYSQAALAAAKNKKSDNEGRFDPEYDYKVPGRSTG